MQHIYVHRQQQRKRKGTKSGVTGGGAAQSKYAQARTKKNTAKQMMSNTAESNMQDHNPLHRLMQAPPKSGRPPVRPSTGKKPPAKA